MDSKEFYDLMENLGDEIRGRIELGMFEPTEEDEVIIDKIVLPKRPDGSETPVSFDAAILKYQKEYLETDRKILSEIKEQILKYKEGTIVISKRALLILENIMENYVETSIKIIKELENRK